MTSFTPLEVNEDLNSALVNPSSGLRRQAGGGARPVGIVIDRSCRVYITQIPVERIERDGANALRAEFEAFGPVESYKLFTEKSGRFIGSALCTFRNPADASNAIARLNGQTVDSSVLKVEVARDHGVLLLHQERTRDGAVGGRGRHGFLPARLSEESAITSRADGDRWHHDRYDLIAEGKDMDEVLGSRPNRRGGRGGRGGGGHAHLTRGERIDSAFDKYIAERDALIENNKVKDEVHVPTPQNEEANVQLSGEKPHDPAVPASADAVEAEGEEKTDAPLQKPPQAPMPL